ncbi:MAG TPA: D-2-hydroxyacid dehydrogenase family protein [Chloroflexota bacterium]|nr:D-2-hydroxyacid dehydrogenase family protein [Chloroflexota bacterium]
MRIAVLDDYQQVARRFGSWERLPSGSELTVFHDHLADHDAVIQRLLPFEVVVAMRERTPFPRAVLAALPNLRLLVTTGMGNAAIDLAATKALGITVAGTGGVAPATAELTWGLILAVARHIPEEDGNVRGGGWQRTVGVDLAGRTLGVIGLGNLGKRVAAVGLAFGMEVIAWSQNLMPGPAAAVGVLAVSKEELLRRADIVTIHLRLSERTLGLLGEAELRLLKPTALLVNTSRGPIVDEAALLAALFEGRIAGAGLDVYDVEPLPAGHPLRTAPRTVLTPHLGYVTEATYEVFYHHAVDDIIAFAGGAPIRTL